MRKGDDLFNPFSNVGSVVEGDEFVGREALVKRLVRQTCGVSAVNLACCWGIPRIGKTSLMFKLISECKHFSGEKCIAIYVDLSIYLMPGGAVDFWKNICQQLADSLGVDIALEMEGINAAINEFKKLLVEVKKHNKYTLLVVDEFCTCLKMSDAECNAFINSFRALFGGGLSCLGLSQCLRCRIISRRDPDYIESQTGGSTLRGLFGTNVIRLPLFGENDFKDLCSLLPTRLPAESLRFLFERTGGHPYLAGMILSFYRERQIDNEKCDVREALVGVTPIITDYFNNLQALIDEAGADKIYVPSAIGMFQEYVKGVATRRENPIAEPLQRDKLGLCAKTAASNIPILTVDLDSGCVWVEDRKVEFAPAICFTILVMSLAGIAKDDFIDCLDALENQENDIPDELRTASWLNEARVSKKEGGYALSARDSADPQRRKNLLGRHLDSIRRAFQAFNLPTDWRVVPWKNSLTNYPKSQIRWRLGNASSEKMPDAVRLCFGAR